MKNNVQKLTNEFNNIKNKYEKEIENYLQEEFNKIDKNIKVYIFANCTRIQVKYNNFGFEFSYFYERDGKLYLHGYGKTNDAYKYTDYEIKIRKKSYTYVREILKGILEKDNDKE